MTVTASAVDPAPGSGLSTLTYSLDGGADAPYSGPFTLGDGSHTIAFTATDAAGNSATSTQTVNVDTGIPVLTIDPISGTSGDNGWYTSAAAIGASADDPAPGSGLASLTYSLDGGAPEAYAGPVALGDGAHTITFTATDAAGNSASETRTVNVDTLAPQLSLNGDASFCPGCGDTLAVGYSVQDDTSGIASWTLLVDGTTLASGTAAGSGTFDWDGSGLPAGAQTLTLESRDLAGNVSRTTLPVTLTSPTPVPPGGAGPNAPANTRAPKGQPTSTGSSPTAKAPQAQTSIQTATSKKETSIVAFDPPVAGNSTSGGAASLSNPPALDSPGVLFGAEAAAAIGVVMALVVAEQKRRKEEEERQAADAMKFNVSMIAWEEEQALLAAQRVWAQKEAERLAREKAEYEYKLNVALSLGLSYNDIAYYQSMASKEGYPAAIAALDRYIAGAQEYRVLEAQFQEHLRQEEERKRREEEERKRREEEERKRKEAEAAAAAEAEAEKKKPWWEKAIDGVKKAVETIADVVTYCVAAVGQCILDLTLLGSYKLPVIGITPNQILDSFNNESIQNGREAGRKLSNVIAGAAIFAGALLVATAITITSGISAGGAACTTGTAGGCAALALPLVGVTVIVGIGQAVAGVALAAYGGGILAINYSDPLGKSSEPNFRTKNELTEHYNKHKGEFDYQTPEEYLDGARKLINGGDDVLTYVRSNGDTLYYNPNTNEFAVVGKDGTIITYFKPEDRMQYWIAQTGGAK